MSTKNTTRNLQYEMDLWTREYGDEARSHLLKAAPVVQQFLGGASTAEINTVNDHEFISGYARSAFNALDFLSDLKGVRGKSIEIPHSQPYENLEITLCTAELNTGEKFQFVIWASSYYKAFYWVGSLEKYMPQSWEE